MNFWIPFAHPVTPELKNCIFGGILYVDLNILRTKKCNIMEYAAFCGGKADFAPSLENPSKYSEWPNISYV